jgi:hypothetical protein
MIDHTGRNLYLILIIVFILKFTNKILSDVQGDAEGVEETEARSGRGCCSVEVEGSKSENWKLSPLKKVEPMVSFKTFELPSSDSKIWHYRDWISSVQFIDKLSPSHHCG